MLQGRDIVITGLQPWDVPIGSNCKNIAIELAKHNRVLYVNAPLDRITSFKNTDGDRTLFRKRVINGKVPDLEQIAENFYTFYPKKGIESINFIKTPFLFNLLNKRNNRIYAQEVKRICRQLNFKDIIFFNDNDIYRPFYFKELLNPAVYVYYIRDYLLAVDYWKKHGSRMEPELIKKADVVVANSTYLAEYGSRYNRHSFYVGQGCEIEDFVNYNQSILPAEFKDIKRPVIGYVGALLSLRLNIGLIDSIARHNLNYTIMLVGPEDEAFKQSALHQLPNVVFTGAKKPEEMPAYIAGFDVCINPQVVNEVTIGNYPRKIDEYLAMGKPVVATNTPAMDVFKEHCYLAKSAEEYNAAIAKALEENNAELAAQRVRFASRHTWEASVEEISRVVELFESKRK